MCVPGQGEEEGDAGRFPVEEDAVLGLAVLVEPLSMIAENGNDGVSAIVAERCEQLPDAVVGHGDLPVVVVGKGEAPPEGGWSPRSVGIEEVDPEEERSVVPVREPGDGTFGRPWSRTLIEEFVVVCFEALGDSELRVEHVCADERGGLIAGVLGHLCEGDGFGADPVAPIVPHSVAERILAGEDRGVGRKRYGDRSQSVLEENAPAREFVQVGGVGRLVAIAADSVCAGGVEGDEEQVRTLRFSAATENGRRQRGGREVEMRGPDARRPTPGRGLGRHSAMCGAYGENSLRPSAAIRSGVAIECTGAGSDVPEVGSRYWEGSMRPSVRWKKSSRPVLAEYTP
jgi:hypothetical protein